MRILFALALLFLTTAASGQSDRKAAALTGIKEFSLVIEELDPDAAKCGVTEEDLETSLRFVLQQSKISIKREAIPYIYFNANIIAASDGRCFGSFSLDVGATVRIESTGRIVAGRIWSVGGVRAGGRSGFREGATSSAEAFAKRLVSDWSKVNQ